MPLIKKARIHLFYFPPNRTHILQLLDVGVFGECQTSPSGSHLAVTMRVGPLVPICMEEMQGRGEMKTGPIKCKWHAILKH